MQPCQAETLQTMGAIIKEIPSFFLLISVISSLAKISSSFLAFILYFDSWSTSAVALSKFAKFKSLRA